jgi:hypothetical protein
MLGNNTGKFHACSSFKEEFESKEDLDILNAFR